MLLPFTLQPQGGRGQGRSESPSDGRQSRNTAKDEGFASSAAGAPGPSKKPWGRRRPPGGPVNSEGRRAPESPAGPLSVVPEEVLRKRKEANPRERPSPGTDPDYG